MIIDTNLEFVKNFLTLKIGGLFDVFRMVFEFTGGKFDKLDTFYLKMAEFEFVSNKVQSDVNNIENDVNKKSSDGIKNLFNNMLKLLMFINMIGFFLSMSEMLKQGKLKKEVVDIMENSNLDFINKIKSILND